MHRHVDIGVDTFYHDRFVHGQSVNPFRPYPTQMCGQTGSDCAAVDGACLPRFAQTLVMICRAAAMQVSSMLLTDMLEKLNSFINENLVLILETV